MKTARLLILSLTALMATTTAVAGNAGAGQTKSATCAACHGPAGISTNPLWPNLAGQNEAYLVKQIKAFKGGERNDPNMNAMVAALSDEDIADLAAFYAAQTCK